MLIKSDDEGSLQKPVAVYSSVTYKYSEYSSKLLKISSIRIAIGAYIGYLERSDKYERFKWFMN